MEQEAPAAILVLELVGQRAGTLGRESRCVFKASSGTIGRALENTWVLPEPWVSSTHARIDFADGAFWLTDLSRNGIYSVELGGNIDPRVPFRIRNRSRFLIGDFEIQSTLLDEDGLPLEGRL